MLRIAFDVHVSSSHGLYLSQYNWLQQRVDLIYTFKHWAENVFILFYCILQISNVAVNV